MIIGIDPGISGAIAFIRDGADWNTGYWDTADMPIMPKSGGKGNQIDPYQLKHVLTLFGPVERAYVERVSAMPGQGVTSVFSFGKSAGIIEGVVACLGIPMVTIAPATWKKRAGLTGKDKDMARTLAMQLFPQIAHHFSRKKDVGRADAILIAHYGSAA